MSASSMCWIERRGKYHSNDSNWMKVCEKLLHMCNNNEEKVLFVVVVVFVPTKCNEGYLSHLHYPFPITHFLFPSSCFTFFLILCSASFFLFSSLSFSFPLISCFQTWNQEQGGTCWDMFSLHSLFHSPLHVLISPPGHCHHEKHNIISYHMIETFYRINKVSQQWTDTTEE